jgi:tRNA(Ile)-lysidine synthase
VNPENTTIEPKIKAALAKEITYIEQTSGRVIVAYSGGLDSCVLLNLVCKFINRPIYAIHINHGLNPDAELWQDHCAQSCKILKVDYVSTNVAVSSEGSQEAAAREVRYEAFESFLEQDDLLLLAHHLNDQIETLFLKMFRGSAPFGLEGMPKHRKLGLGSIYRPLLEISQEEIRDYAEFATLNWIDDSSNQNVAFDRNFLRHKIIPLIESRWPNFKESLVKNDSSTRRVRVEMLALAKMDFENVSLCNDRLDLLALGRLSFTRQLSLIRYWFQSLHLAHIPGESMMRESLNSFFVGGDNTSPKLEWRGKVLQRFSQVLYMYDALDSSALSDSHKGKLTSDTTMIKLGNGYLTLGKLFSSGLAIEDITNLSIRRRKGGEQMAFKEQHKSLKNLFQENAIPVFLRDYWPLLFYGEELICIPAMPAWDIEAIIAPQYEAHAATANVRSFEWHLKLP